MTAEPLTPHDLARLLLDAAPHMDLIERAAPHLSTLRPLLPMLTKWDAVAADLEWAAQAPVHLRATAHQAVFLMLSKEHGGTPQLWGAVGHEVIKRRAQTPAAPVEEKPKRPRYGGKQRTVHTPAEVAAMRARLVTAGTLVLACARPLPEIRALLAEKCDVSINVVVIGGLRTGRLVRELDAGQWPKLSPQRLEDVIAALELIGPAAPLQAAS